MHHKIVFAQSIITDRKLNFQWIVKKMLTTFAEKPPNFSVTAIAICTKIM